MRYQRFSKIHHQNGDFFSVKNIFIKKSDKNKSFDIETFWMLFFGPELWFFHKLESRKPQDCPAQNVKTATPGIYSLNFRENQRWWRKWLWYLDSASLNYPGTVILISVIFLLEMCVIGRALVRIPRWSIKKFSHKWKFLMTHTKHFSFQIYFNRSTYKSDLLKCLSYRKQLR